MFQRSDVKEGMIVKTIEGQKLGKIFAVGDGEFHIEKGIFFPKDYVVRYSEISDIKGEDIILNQGSAALRQQSTEDQSTATTTTAGMGASAAAASGLNRGGTTEKTTLRSTTDTRLPSDDLRMATDKRTSGNGKELRKGLATERTMNGRREDIAIPVAHEELEVSKHEVDAGKVRIFKDVVEEEKIMDVPVRRERVRVDRHNVEGRPALDAAFQEETVVVPLHAEEVDVRKRAVVDEEVIIHKEDFEEQRRVTERVRHENIRTESDVEDPRTLIAPTSDDLKTRRS